MGVVEEADGLSGSPKHQNAFSDAPATSGLLTGVALLACSKLEDLYDVCVV